VVFSTHKSFSLKDTEILFIDNIDLSCPFSESEEIPVNTQLRTNASYTDVLSLSAHCSLWQWKVAIFKSGGQPCISENKAKTLWISLRNGLHADQVSTPFIILYEAGVYIFYRKFRKQR